MARKKQTRGTCTFCGREMTKGGLSRHLASCPQRAEAIAKANTQRGRNQTIYHLQVQDAWAGDYWLHLEMRGGATLEELDRYLRAIWLECCGHLSAFTLGYTTYTQLFDDGFSMGEEASMDISVNKLFEPGLQIPYEYDFGTTSELLIKVVAERKGKPLTEHPIMLMARNQAPALECQECGKTAAWLCMECIYEEEKPGLLCDTHAKKHPHDDYGEPVPLVNSPRTGMCGYDGPAEPPY